MAHYLQIILKLFILIILIFSFLILIIDCHSNKKSSTSSSSSSKFEVNKKDQQLQKQQKEDLMLNHEANDEEIALPSEDSTSIQQLLDRQFLHRFQEWPINNNFNSNNNGNDDYDGNGTNPLFKNCSYVYQDIFCDCDQIHRKFICHNIQTQDDIRRAFDHLLNQTRLIYWNLLEINCIEPNLMDDSSTESNSNGIVYSNGQTSKPITNPPNKSFHISYEMFIDGPRFETILFNGDCSKTRHYDNLITVDRDVRQIVMYRNLLRMSTSCSLLQPKFERLDVLILKDCLVAGDMISSTFSTRCLGQYGTRNEPMQLSKLIITSSNISLIESGAFYNFAELELIDLSRNQITHLSRQVFAPHLYRLRTLKLDHNKLKNLNDEFFEKLPELREVILSNNFLKTLPFLPSAGPGVAQVLQLRNNPWDCRCKLIWLLEEPMDSIRLISDEPKCSTPENFQNKTLFKGLQMVKDTFC